MFKVFWKDVWPRKKREYFRGQFATRQKARQWCRNHVGIYSDLSIEHPDGTVELYGVAA